METFLTTSAKTSVNSSLSTLHHGRLATTTGSTCRPTPRREGKDCSLSVLAATIRVDHALPTCRSPKQQIRCSRSGATCRVTDTDHLCQVAGGAARRSGLRSSGMRSFFGTTARSPLSVQKRSGPREQGCCRRTFDRVHPRSWSLGRSLRYQIALVRASVGSLVGSYRLIRPLSRSRGSERPGRQTAPLYPARRFPLWAVHRAPLH